MLRSELGPAVRRSSSPPTRAAGLGAVSSCPGYPRQRPAQRAGARFLAASRRTALDLLRPPSMNPPPALSRPPTAVVVLNGDDVYEDLFSAGLKLQELLAGRGSRPGRRWARPRWRGGRTAARTWSCCTPRWAIPARPAGGAGCGGPVRGRVAGAARLERVPRAGGLLDAAYRLASELIGSRYVSHGPRAAREPVPGRVRPDHRSPVTAGDGAVRDNARALPARDGGRRRSGGLARRPARAGSRSCTSGSTAAAASATCSSATTCGPGTTRRCARLVTRAARGRPGGPGGSAPRPGGPGVGPRASKEAAV